MTTLLDGGIGQELINRGAPRSAELWSAWVLIDDPGLATAVHSDELEPGSEVSAPHGGSPLADRLGVRGLADLTEELARLAGNLGREVTDTGGRDVQVAGCVQPL